MRLGGALAGPRISLSKQSNWSVGLQIVTERTLFGQQQQLQQGPGNMARGGPARQRQASRAAAALVKVEQEPPAAAARPEGLAGRVAAARAGVVKKEEVEVKAEVVQEAQLASPARAAPGLAAATTPLTPEESRAAWVASNELRKEKLQRKAAEREAKAAEREVVRLAAKAAKAEALAAQRAAKAAAKAAGKETAEETADPAQPQAAPPARPSKRRRRGAATAEAEEAAETGETGCADAEEAEAGAALPKRRRGSRAQREAAAAEAVLVKGELQEPHLAAQAASAQAEPAAKPARRKGAKAAAAGAAAGEAAPEEGAGEEPLAVLRKPARPRKKKGDPDDYPLPTRDILPALLASPLPPRPVPNFGYCCLNMELKEMRPPVFTNRDCVKKTREEKGLPFVSQLALENCRALPAILQWNHANNIRFFRLTSGLFPWCTTYELQELPDWAAICEALAFAGEVARATAQRISFHPSHFVKLASPDEAYLAQSIKELEVHSQIFDLMGYAQPSPENKINIHIGGRYGDKEASLVRFAAGFRRLSPACQARLTVENDDLADSYSITDLLPLHRDIGCPLVFDFHHHRFCPGGLTEKEALEAAMGTWPPGVRPVVHWSESQEGRKPQAHSDYIHGPMNLHGHEAEIDVQIEAKCKERTLLRFREQLAAGPQPDLQLATKFL